MPTEIHNTFGIKAYANRYVEYSSCDELQSIVPTLQGSPCLHIGAGSNLLFTKDFDGTILHSRIKSIEVVSSDDAHVLLRVGAGVVWDDFVDYTVRHGWSGAENLSLIPGEVGASAVQNIGAYGVEAKDLIEQVECVGLKDGSLRTFSNDECHYSYRRSIFKEELKGQYAVTYVTYRLSKVFTPQLDYGNIRSRFSSLSCITPKDVRSVIIDIRRNKLPDTDVLGNAGSFFMNPIVSESKYKSLAASYPDIPSYKAVNGVKIPAAWLIEQCGWKGRTMGHAGVYEKQALILVNLGGATGVEIVDLCNAIRRDVMDKFDIDIQPEVNII